jgi:hypothetical protein
LCAFAAYVPILGVRGAAFCLFPGLAQRSIRLTLVGVLLGFLADIGVTIFWMIVGGVWEPRWGGYNDTLAHYLPPDIMVATHVGSPMPNSIRFALGLVLWSVTMYAIWTLLWRPKLELERRVQILVTSAITVGLCAIVLWTVAPLSVMLGGRYQPFGDLPTKPFLAVLFTTMPISSLIVAMMIYFQSKSQATQNRLNVSGGPRPT